MASVAVMTAVEARVATYWSASAVVAANTSGDTPAAGTAFLTVQYPVASEDHISLGQVGQRGFRENGGIRFVLSIPRGEGISYWQGLLEALTAYFRAAQFGGVSTLSPSPPLTDDSNDNGSYWLLTSVVEYYFDIFA